MKKILVAGAFVFGSLSVFAQSKPEGLLVNEKAPDFTAMDQSGNSIQLEKELKKGKTVLVFYRGEWCPYCNKQLSDLQDSAQMITDKGARLLAITPETEKGIAKTVEKTEASFPILHDKDLKIMTDYRVAFPVDENTITRYKKYGIDFDVANGENGANLPVPALYIIDQNGTIIYRYFEVDYKKRPSVKEILSHL